MDRNNINIAVLSAFSNGVQDVESKETAVKSAFNWNNELYDSVNSKNKVRFRLFAALPMSDVEAATTELKRCVSKGFVGALINGYDSSNANTKTYYDTKEYLPFWKTVERLDVPLYIHPRLPLETDNEMFQWYPESRGPAYGFHSSTCELVFRLILSGLFEKCPKLKIIIGHMGEMILFWAWRMDHAIQKFCYSCTEATVDRRRALTVTETLQRNFYVTISGFYSKPAFHHALAIMGADRILFATDYPLEYMSDAVRFLEELDIDEETKMKIAQQNGQKLLNIWPAEGSLGRLRSKKER